MISAKRLEQLRDRFDIDNDFDRRDKYIAINELIAARTRIAELEQERDEQGRNACELFDECKRRRLELEQLRAQGLSQEDREALDAGAKALDDTGHMHWCGVYTTSSGDCSCEYYERRDRATILRRLGGQTI